MVVTTKSKRTKQKTVKGRFWAFVPLCPFELYKTVALFVFQHPTPCHTLLSDFFNQIEVTISCDSLEIKINDNSELEHIS